MGDTMAAVALDRTRDTLDPAVPVQTRRQAAEATTQEAARAVLDVLGGALAAYVLGVKDRKTLQRWANGAVRALRPDHEATLRGVHEIILLLGRFEATTTIRAWFLGMAPELDGSAPARAIHDGHLIQAMGAARAFIAHG